MIKHVTGDILLTRAQAIAHSVAPMDPMNRGLALALHQKYPAMHKDFHHWCHQQHGEPGKAWMWGGSGGARIINLITQDPGVTHAHPGKATVKHVRDSLRALLKIIKAEAFTSLALPRLATGTGGLQWQEVEPLITEMLGELDIPVYVYTEYHAGVAADES